MINKCWYHACEFIYSYTCIQTHIHTYHIYAHTNRPAKAVFESLSKHGIVCDFREPDVVRLAPCPLYNTFSEVSLRFFFVESVVDLSLYNKTRCARLRAVESSRFVFIVWPYMRTYHSTCLGTKIDAYILWCRYLKQFLYSARFSQHRREFGQEITSETNRLETNVSVTMSQCHNVTMSHRKPTV
jgi:hypothetical protein